MRQILLAALCASILLISACQSTANAKSVATKAPLNDVTLSSRDWTAAGMEDSVASQARIQRVERQVFRVEYQIDYPALDAGSVGYNGSNMGYFVMCVASQVTTMAKQRYFWMGTVAGEPTLDGKLPPATSYMYVFVSDKKDAQPPKTARNISWSDDGMQIDVAEMEMMCQGIFGNYPRDSALPSAVD